MLTEFITLSFCLILSIERVWCTESEQVNKTATTASPNDWDFLVYSQEWPATVCSEWRERAKANTCKFPNDKTSWTVHGIWPSKIGSKGPENCRSANHFDPGQLTPFIDDLNQHWTNIEANTKPLSFWKHEWDKHGTCASVLPELNSVTNYFRQAIEWNEQYKLSKILTQSKVSPGRRSYDAVQIANAVNAFTKSVPTVQCVIDRHTKETLLSEIRLCFNKSLELIDCDKVMPQTQPTNGVITNCKKPIMYYGASAADDATNRYPEEDWRRLVEEQNYYVNMYKLLKFLIWFTT